jgi:hypothetical protein
LPPPTSKSILEPTPGPGDDVLEGGYLQLVNQEKFVHRYHFRIPSGAKVMRHMRVAAGGA